MEKKSVETGGGGGGGGGWCWQRKISLGLLRGEYYYIYYYNRKFLLARK